MAGAVATDQAAASEGLAALHAGTANYYSGKIRRHGPVPLGVDWTCEPTQNMRFVQLLKVCGFTSPFSLNDIGCGYGALVAFLRHSHPACAVDYLGIDLSPDMVAAARDKWWGVAGVAFEVGSGTARPADYSVASGIFNVRLNQPTAMWEQLVASTLAGMHGSSRLGFAVNFLAPLGPGVQQRPQLYRAAPEQWAGFCERSLGVRVQIVQGYGMREYTLLARRNDPA